jgi:hypothetical protein
MRLMMRATRTSGSQIAPSVAQNVKKNFSSGFWRSDISKCGPALHLRLGAPRGDPMLSRGIDHDWGVRPIESPVAALAALGLRLLAHFGASVHRRGERAAYGASSRRTSSVSDTPWHRMRKLLQGRASCSGLRQNPCVVWNRHPIAEPERSSFISGTITQRRFDRHYW